MEAGALPVDLQTGELLLSVALGIGLSAACGFRVFVPYLVMSIAVQSGYLTVGDSWQWMGTWRAVAVFSLATLLEIAAYYVPWLDSFLDTIATPAAVIAGIVATASVLTGMSPLMTWSLAAIAGGGTAGVVQGGTVLLRSASSLCTFGTANFIVSSLEWLGALLFAVLALLLPVVTVFLVVIMVVWAVWRLRSRRRHAPA